MKLKYPKNTPTISIRRNPPALAYCPPRISTHNGVENLFNEYITEARAGKKDYSVHRITLDDAPILVAQAILKASSTHPTHRPSA